MKERPILFSGPMVKAILEGRKTQTRRPVKCQIWKETPVVSVTGHGPFLGEPENTQRWSLDHQTGDGTILVENNVSCPYGQPGDRLWVRETLELIDGVKFYRADGEALAKESDLPNAPQDFLWPSMRNTIPSIHMPRWASRITLEITNVRVERLQDICIEDIEKEGYPRHGAGAVQFWRSFAKIYKLNESASPWVWVVEFRRV